MVNTKTYGIPYMGSKKKIIPSIHNALKDIEFDSVLDMFTGTTRVAQSFRSAGKVVIANDLSDASQCYGSLFLEHPDPKSLQPYLDQMNNLKGYEGWFTENYHGDTSTDDRGDGRFMQYKNTIKVNSIFSIEGKFWYINRNTKGEGNFLKLTDIDILKYRYQTGLDTLVVCTLTYGY